MLILYEFVLPVEVQYATRPLEHELKISTSSFIDIFIYEEKLELNKKTKIIL